MDIRSLQYFIAVVEMGISVALRKEHIITDYLRQCNIAAHYYCTNDDARTCLSWAYSGMGIAFAPSSILYNSKKSSAKQFAMIL